MRTAPFAGGSPSVSCLSLLGKRVRYCSPAAKHRRRLNAKAKARAKAGAASPPVPSAAPLPASGDGPAASELALREAALRERALRQAFDGAQELLRLERKRSRRDAHTAVQRGRQDERRSSKAIKKAKRKAAKHAARNADAAARRHQHSRA